MWWNFVANTREVVPYVRSIAMQYRVWCRQFAAEMLVVYSSTRRRRTVYMPTGVMSRVDLYLIFVRVALFTHDLWYPTAS